MIFLPLEFKVLLCPKFISDLLQKAQEIKIDAPTIKPVFVNFVVK